jgi:ATP-dependent DNA helicase 2 subunit 1
MRIILEQLQLPGGAYDPAKYPNPDLQWFYRILQAMALEEDIPENPIDKTVPRYRQIDKRCGEYIEDYGQEFEVALQQQSKGITLPAPAAKKRSADAEDKPLVKRVKKEPQIKDEDDENDGPSDQQMADLNNKGQISKQTVAVFKVYLSQRGQSTAGKKADLIERVQDYLEGKGL